MAQVSYQAATCVYPSADTPAIDQLSLDIPDGRFVVVLGPQGAGKSTMLRMLAGLEETTGGRILMDGVDLAAVPARERDVAMVFQNYALYPHMSIAENMGFALKLKGVERAERDAKVREAAQLLDLERYLDRRPRALSGGQRQRVAMARAIVREPSVFLMDEPLSNLDPALRTQTRQSIVALQQRMRTTTLYATHDAAEALEVAGTVALLNDGRLQQYGPVEQLLAQPANVFVAGYLGTPPMNLRESDVVPDGVRFGQTTVAWSALPPEGVAALRAAAAPRVVLGVRPDDLVVGTPDPGTVAAAVGIIEQFGDRRYAYCTLSGDAPEPGLARGKAVLARVGDGVTLQPEQAVGLRLVGAAHLFDAATGVRLAAA